MNLKSIMLGVIITGITLISIKVGCEYGKYSAIHDVYKRGWKIIDPNNEEKEQNTSTKETES